MYSGQICWKTVADRLSEIAKVRMMTTLFMFNLKTFLNFGLIYQVEKQDDEQVNIQPFFG